MNRSYSSSNFYGKVFKLALPIAAQSMIVIGVNMLDTMMVGKLGDDPLSATSLANSFISVFQIFCMGLGMGASVLVSRYWGMKQSSADRTQADDASIALKQTVSLMLRLTIVLAFLFASATLFCPGLIMRSYTEDEKIIELGIKYFATTLASSRWKSLEQIERAGLAAEQAVGGVTFWAQNWRKGGLQERRNEVIREQGFYNQTWCGCEFSRNLNP